MMMWDGGNGMDGWGSAVWVVIMLAVLALIVVGVVLLVRGTLGRHEAGQPAQAQGLTPPASGSALQVLEERYARGEIDREEFLQRKADLQG
jgi:putative membrane protein